MTDPESMETFSGRIQEVTRVAVVQLGPNANGVSVRQHARLAEPAAGMTCTALYSPVCTWEFFRGPGRNGQGKPSAVLQQEHDVWTMKWATPCKQAFENLFFCLQGTSPLPSFLPHQREKSHKTEANTLVSR